MLHARLQNCMLNWTNKCQIKQQKSARLATVIGLYDITYIFASSCRQTVSKVMHTSTSSSLQLGAYGCVRKRVAFVWFGISHQSTSERTCVKSPSSTPLPFLQQQAIYTQLYTDQPGVENTKTRIPRKHVTLTQNSRKIHILGKFHPKNTLTKRANPQTNAFYYHHC